MTTTSIIIVILAVLVLAAVAFYLVRQQRTRRLRSRFGPEYERTVREFGSRPKAEEALAARERRVEKFHIHTLPPGERDRYASRWHEVQARFVDDPAASIQEADRLVSDVMIARGYPMADFDRRAEDISVDHPEVVKNYRMAHAIAARQEEGQASTEDLRRALVYYRDLCDELLEAHMAGPKETRR